MSGDIFHTNDFNSFLVLLQHIDRTNYNEEEVADLLEKFIVSSKIGALILDQCITPQKESHVWDEIIVCLTSLPERAANKFKMKTREIFSPGIYIGQLASSIYFVLQKVQERLSLEKDTSLEFVSRLLGKLCIVGYADISFDYLCPHLVHMMRNSFLWRKICQRLITGVPPRCTESVLTALLQKVTWYGYVEWFLGDTINSQNIQYLLTTKFLLIRYFEKDLLPRNVIGYLAHSERRNNLFHKVVLALLDIWSDGSALKHQSYSQQLYLSRLLMMATGHLKVYGKKSWKQDFMEKLLKGVHNRIASSEPSVRILGMVIAEAMSAVVNTEAPRLQFEYEETQEIIYLRSLLIIPQDPELKCGETKEIKFEPNISKVKSKYTEINNKSAGTCKEDLDSDDDLECFDLSIDETSVPGKEPLYLIECLKGLMNEEKADWHQKCLEHAEDLIRQEPDNLSEIALDLCKILLHLENLYALPNFANLKQGSLVALCVYCPVQIADVLSKEFYNRNYSIRQRIDILQILAVASRELSGIEERLITNTITERRSEITGKEPKKDIEENWKSIIARRIANKTRIISKKRELSSPKENKFAHVAGKFFFPLLAQFDRAENTFDLLDGDSYLLGHFIYTLGIIMYCAVNIPIAGQMGKCFLEFIWTLKYHTDKFVQKALLFSLCMIISSVPSHILLSEFQEDIFECKQWLQSIINESFDPECKTIASQASALMLKLLKEGILIDSSEIL